MNFFKSFSTYFLYGSSSPALEPFMAVTFSLNFFAARSRNMRSAAPSITP